jgi:hypothetical protein
MIVNLLVSLGGVSHIARAEICVKIVGVSWQSETSLAHVIRKVRPMEWLLRNFADPGNGSGEVEKGLRLVKPIDVPLMAEVLFTISEPAYEPWNFQIYREWNMGLTIRGFQKR